jgi:molybdopterin-guanine dinucleotide biosynthesis protein A
MPEPLSVIILAGGRSSRMGQDKASLLLDGRPLIWHVAQRLLPLAGELIISSNEPERFAALGADLPIPVQVVPDQYAGAGPLAGLQAGLSVATRELALLVAVDMPLLSRSLLAYMQAIAGGHAAVVPRLALRPGEGEEYEPLHALYRRSCLPAITAHLAQNHRRVVSFFPDVDVRDVTRAEIERFDPGLFSFFNVNTPQDWEQAQELLRQARSE